MGADLLLLAIDRNLHIVRDRRKVGYAVLGADLIELAAVGRVEVVRVKRWSERIHVTDPQPTGDPLLDASLAALAEARRPPDPADWAQQKLRHGVLEDYLQSLSAQEMVRLYPRRITRRITFTEAALLEPGHQARVQVRARVDRLAVDGAPADAMDWALAGLVYESWLGMGLYPGRVNRDSYRRLKEAARGDRGKGSADPVDMTIRAAMRATRYGDNDASSQ